MFFFPLRGKYLSVEALQSLVAFYTNVFNLFALSMYYHLPVSAASVKGLSIVYLPCVYEAITFTY